MRGADVLGARGQIPDLVILQGMITGLKGPDHLTIIFDREIMMILIM